MQPKEDERDADRDERKEGKGDEIAGEHVGVEPDGERQNARTVRDDLDGKEQRREPPDRPEELLDVGGAVGADAVELVVDESDQGEAERHGDVGRGRLEARDKADEVGQQDKEQKAW